MAVTNGGRHLRSLRDLVENAVRGATPGWRMRPPTQAFAAENAAAPFAVAFESVTCVRPAGAGPVILRDPAVAANYVASLASHYQAETALPGTRSSRTCAGTCRR